MAPYLAMKERGSASVKLRAIMKAVKLRAAGARALLDVPEAERAATVQCAVTRGLQPPSCTLGHQLPVAHNDFVKARSDHVIDQILTHLRARAAPAAHAARSPPSTWAPASRRTARAARPGADAPTPS